MVSFSPNYRKIRNTDADTPNELLYTNAEQFGEWKNALKANAIYVLPWGLQYSTSILGQTEAYYNREVRVRNKVRDSVTLDIQRQFGRLPFVTIWDNRLSKTFEIGDRQSIEATFDLYNTMNANGLTRRLRERHGSRFLEPREILGPRVFRLGVRYRF